MSALDAAKDLLKRLADEYPGISERELLKLFMEHTTEPMRRAILRDVVKEMMERGPLH